LNCPAEFREEIYVTSRGLEPERVTSFAGNGIGEAVFSARLEIASSSLTLGSATSIHASVGDMELKWVDQRRLMKMRKAMQRSKTRTPIPAAMPAFAAVERPEDECESPLVGAWPDGDVVELASFKPGVKG
jgi:hypothetical protein